MLCVCVSVHVFTAQCLVLKFNSAPVLSSTVSADEMASFGCSRICRTKRFSLSDTRTFSKSYKTKCLIIIRSNQKPAKKKEKNPQIKIKQHVVLELRSTSEGELKVLLVIYE